MTFKCLVFIVEGKTYAIMLFALENLNYQLERM